MTAIADSRPSLTDLADHTAALAGDATTVDDVTFALGLLYDTSNDLEHAQLTGALARHDAAQIDQAVRDVIHDQAALFHDLGSYEANRDAADQAADDLYDDPDGAARILLDRYRTVDAALAVVAAA